MDIALQNNNYLDSSCGMESNSGIFENFVTFKELEQVNLQIQKAKTAWILIGNLLPFANSSLMPLQTTNITTKISYIDSKSLCFY